MHAAARLRGASHLASAAVWDQSHEIRFVLQDFLDHPFYWWPRTLLTYPIEFHSPADLDRLVLTPSGTGEQIPIQFTEVQRGEGVRSATLNFFSDLPSGARREFVLSVSATPVTARQQVKETREGDTIVLDSGAIRVGIPATQTVHGDAPGPILQVSRGGAWVGSSTLGLIGDTITRITANRVADGPLFVAYELAYESQGGSRYVATVQCEAGMDFVRFRENMEGVHLGIKGVITSTWSGFPVAYRQAPNHPYPESGKIRKYEDYPWERVDEPWPLDPEPLVDGELPFNLGIYQTWTAFRTGTFANFWCEESSDALGVFIDKVDGWQDHKYANHVEDPALEVRYFYRNGVLTWNWPIVHGSRSTCLAFYDHAKDKEAQHRVEKYALGVEQGGFNYRVGLIYVSYAQFLQNRYGTLDLNCVKDWVLEYSKSARRPPVIFSTGQIKDAGELESKVLAGPFASTLPVNGTRENGGASTIPGRGIVNFSPVPSRQVQAWWVDGFNRCSAQMNERQWKRLTAMYLLMAYVHAGDDFMPMVPMLSGHPNFLADVKAVPAIMSFLFPEHPMAETWADLWQKYVELNTRYNTRPEVELWDAHGGRWTENLGTYVWAFLRPSVRADFLLRKFDGVERFVTPQIAELADWLVNALSAPFDGETKEAYEALQSLDRGHAWGALAPGQGPKRVHPPQGAHSERRVPPRSMWYLGTCLQRYAPLAAEHAMWAARPTNQDMETKLGVPNAWDAIYRVPDNLGTNPHLRSRKYTGYGIVMRSAVGKPQEVSIHLQQIDEGPNYRWGRAAEGGCGVIYYFAAGKSYSFNGTEDVGDRDDQDTDFCTNFGVYKDGEFRSIGQNVLSRPFYDLGFGQFAELVPRQEPGAYSAPEYVSRSVLSAGHDYFLVCDRVLHQMIVHRFSWFVRRGSALPTIQFVRGAGTSERETQRTEVETTELTGFWMDGRGDSMAVVSHLAEIQAEAQPYGCRVRGNGFDDSVFRSADPVDFSDGSISFSGTAGIVRRKTDQTEFALFYGTKIGIDGLTFTTADTDLGIGGVIAPHKAARGVYDAPQAGSIRISLSAASEKAVFYIDGAAQTVRRVGDWLAVDLKQGAHRWELTGGLPVPIAPQIVRTENHSDGARVIITPVAAASQYRLEISKDNGATWASASVSKDPAAQIHGLAEGEKVHLRAVAINAAHESEPGSEYPLYVSKEPPSPPDGLHVELFNGSARLTWGEVLGVGEYRLYSRRAPNQEFRCLYRGVDRMFTDPEAAIRAPLAQPEEPAAAPQPNLIEYSVACVNANGEGPRSRIANIDPGTWRNWDPVPGEPFRRVFADMSPSASIRVPTKWPRYYPH
ncbi:MAG TPA: hypothetical protein VGS10_04030 [Terracidiphilus sp.]|nr:hypothetical protein [Terracidiphilus sp.]